MRASAPASTATIWRIVKPVVQDPLEAEWSNVSASIADQLAKRDELRESAKTIKDTKKFGQVRTRANERQREAQALFSGFLEKLRQFKIPERELSYLTAGQITALLDQLKLARNKHVLLVTRLALVTGARWSEAEELNISQVHDGFVQFAKTKSGKLVVEPST